MGKQGAVLRKLDMGRVWCEEWGKPGEESRAEHRGLESYWGTAGLFHQRYLGRGLTGSDVHFRKLTDSSVEKGRQETICLPGSGDQESNATPENIT